MYTVDYDRRAACDYAKKWAFDRNPSFYNFEKLGGDCTNFASQCIYAGSGVMNYTPVFGWYYNSSSDRTASWTGVDFLHNFLLDNKAAGPFGSVVDLALIEPGDIIQLRFDEGGFRHCPVVVSVGRRKTPEDILIAAHSYDAYGRPLSSYVYTELRPIHIEGVRR